MIPGNLNKLSFYFTVFFFIANFIYAEDKIETVPLINLEELSPTFEEEKSELEKLEEVNSTSLSSLIKVLVKSKYVLNGAAII